MNYRLKILEFLKKFDGDADYHNIEPIMEGLSYDQMRMTTQDLAKQDYIKAHGGTDFMHVEQNHPSYKPIKARITLQGSQYLKELLKEQSNMTFNIQNSNNLNLAVNSPNAKLRQDISTNEIEKIVSLLKENQTIDIIFKDELIKQVQEIRQNPSHSESNIKNLVGWSADLIQIGQAIQQLFQAL